MTQSEHSHTTEHAQTQPPLLLPRLSRLDAADIAAARQHHSLVELLERHGIAVVGSGPRRTARCPFHDDRSPSLSVYLDSNRYYCFACGASGDAISLLQRLDGLDFREAVARLTHSVESSISPGAESGADVMPRDPEPSDGLPDAQETLFQEPSEEVTHRVQAHAEPQAVDLLTVAAALYQAALATSQEALAYLRARGIKEDSARRMHVGYGRPGALRDFLGDDPTLVAQARTVGLLDAVGKERLAGRVIIPEVRDGRCLWMVGRTLSEQDAPGSPTDPERPLSHRSIRAEAPKYLGVTAPKPLMGIGVLRSAEPSRNRSAMRTSQRSSPYKRTRTNSDATGVIVVEGPFDLLAAQQWRLPLPCVALVGAHASRQQLLELMAFAAGRPIWLALDADPAGGAGAEHLRKALIAARYAGPLYRLRPPQDAKDFGDVVGRPTARTALLRALTHPEEDALITSGLPERAVVTTSRKRAVEASS